MNYARSAQSARLIGQVQREGAHWLGLASGLKSQWYRDVRYRTACSWSRTRLVLGKADWRSEQWLKTNLMSVVMSLGRRRGGTQELYGALYRVLRTGGDGESD